jgi:hypothetical protein
MIALVKKAGQRLADRARLTASLPPVPEQSPSPEQLEADEFGFRLLEDHDPWAKQRRIIGKMAEHNEEWAGIPMPLEGHELTIEPTYPHAKEIMAITKEPQEEDGVRFVNTWYSRRLQSEIYVWREPDGRLMGGKVNDVARGLELAINTAACSVAWGIEQEHRALKLLGGMIRHHAFKAYLLSGMFIERSERSGVRYIFRKLRPTIALAPERPGEKKIRFLAALCQHPIGYYRGSWGGAMCPTDEVVAHLSMMRGDEHMFWKRSNQHPAWSRSAGL